MGGETYPPIRPARQVSCDRTIWWLKEWRAPRSRHRPIAHNLPIFPRAKYIQKEDGRKRLTAAEHCSAFASSYKVERGLSKVISCGVRDRLRCDIKTDINNKT